MSTFPTQQTMLLPRLIRIILRPDTKELTSTKGFISMSAPEPGNAVARQFSPAYIGSHARPERE